MSVKMDADIKALKKELEKKDAIIHWLADHARARWCAVPDNTPCRYPDKIGEACVQCWIEVAREEVEKHVGG